MLENIPRNPLSILTCISRFLQWLNGFVITSIAFALVICVTWQVIARYVLSSPSTVTDELARFLFMWVGLLGAAQATALKQHLAIDLMAEKLQGWKKRWLNIFIQSCIFAFAAIVMVKGGWALTAKTFANQQITPALQIDMGFVYLVVPLAGGLICFFSLVAITNLFRQQEV